MERVRFFNEVLPMIVIVALGVFFMFNPPAFPAPHYPDLSHWQHYDFTVSPSVTFPMAPLVYVPGGVRG